MNFTLDDEHRMLRDAAQRFVDEQVDLAPLLVPGATTASIDHGKLWPQVAELGWPAMVIPEGDGGLGMDLVSLALVVRECGRTLAPLPLFGTLAGTWALLRAASDAQRRRWLAQVADGSLTMALAIADRDGDCGSGRTGVIASRGPGGCKLSGEAPFVVDGTDARLFIVAAECDGRVRWFAVERTAAGVATERMDWRDITRDVASLSLQDTPAEPLPLAHDDAWPWVRDRLWLLLAVESAGGLQQVLNDTAAYARERVAFGKPIGSYQAIKHQLADMLAQSECAQTALLYAAWVLSAPDHPDGTLAAAIAQSHASGAYRDATHRSIQVFGAIGFTWEMKNHLYFKRARANAALLGCPAHQREVIATILAQRAPQAAATH